jgi:glycosyltransferase involved in cell wall biosynthesis
LTPLRVCVDARLGSGFSGGVEQAVIGLATGLSKLDDGEEDYLFLAHPDQDDWIRPHLAGSARVLHSGLEYPGQPGLVPAFRRSLRRRLPLRMVRRGLVPRSDGTIERNEVEVVHFATQEAFLTDVPSIYQPHDLQHLHLPELFPKRERQRREIVYRTHCERAALVVAMTSWGKGDLVRHYGLAPEKVCVVPWGSVLAAYPAPDAADIDALRSKLGLPDAFLLYPGQTWPHKNHLRLLEALALIRDRDQITIPLVCPGRRNNFYPQIRDRARELGLEEAIRFPGFVTPVELRGLYSLARALVFPSLFEGWGLPVSEAFSSGLPVACSSVAGLPDVVGDAGLLFDPRQPEEIADRILELWTDDELSARLEARGRSRASLFSFERSAKLFRAHYRRIAGKRLPEEDRILLASPPLA